MVVMPRSSCLERVWYLKRQRETKVAGGINVTNQLTQDRESIIGHPGESLITRDLKREAEAVVLEWCSVREVPGLC